MLNRHSLEPVTTITSLLRNTSALLLSCLAMQQAQAFGDTHCHYHRFVDLPVQVTDGNVLAQGSVDGHAATISIHTASHKSFINETLVNQIGLPLTHSGLYMLTAEGPKETFVTIIHELGLGDKSMKQQLRFMVDTRTGLHSEVEIGSDFLSGIDTEVSLAENKVRLFQPENCDSTYLGYWADNASVTWLSQVSAHDHRPIISVTVNGQALRAVIDTASKQSFIDLSAAKSAGVTPESTGAKKMPNWTDAKGDEFESWLVPIDQISIADENIKNAKLLVADIWGLARENAHTRGANQAFDKQPDVILGLDFLKAHRVLLAYSQNRLYFTFLGGSAFDSGR